MQIYPSLMNANLLNLDHAIDQLEPHCAGFHVDVMDFDFVPNMTWGPPTVNAIAYRAHHPIWVHLMVQDALPYIERFELAPQSIVSIHIESKSDLPACIKRIQNKQCIPSIALNPATPISALETIIDLIDHVLIMSVKPGFSGQQFISTVLEKIKKLKTLKPDIIIGMDGGINAQNIDQIKEQGVRDVAISSAIFGQPDPLIALQDLNKLL